MSEPISINHLLRTKKSLRDASGGEQFHPGSRLHIARPIDAESLVGRHEGRAPKASGSVRPKSLSAQIHTYVGGALALGRRRSGRASAGPQPFDPRQQAIVKLHYFAHTGGGANALRKHVHYIERDAARGRDLEEDDRDEALERDIERQAKARSDEPGPSAPPSPLYDAEEDHLVDGHERAARWSRADRLHFRIVLSFGNAAHMGDLKEHTREVMRRAEAALGSKLDWIAADHWDTGEPHTHVILRGRLEDGRDLFIPREYVQHGFRNAARDVATERLGRRGRDDERHALRRLALAHRVTRLDRMIEQQLGPDRRVRIAKLRAPYRAPDVTEALKRRAHELRRLGLAHEIERNVLQFEPGWLDGLKAMEMHLDIRKAMMRDRMGDRDRSRGFDPGRQPPPKPKRGHGLGIDL
jgi:type IV secretory pathway VirD2 relaxase